MTNYLITVGGYSIPIAAALLFVCWQIVRLRRQDTHTRQDEQSRTDYPRIFRKEGN